MEGRNWGERSLSFKDSSISRGVYRRQAVKRRRGFTLIEMLTVIMLLGILGALSTRSFSLYRANAAYGVVEQTLHDAERAAEASLANSEVLPDEVTLFAQSTPGTLTNNAAKKYLLGFQVPRNVKVQVKYDPDCVDSSCYSDFLQINHCNGKKFLRWTRAGDGVEVREPFDGEGCP